MSCIVGSSWWCWVLPEVRGGVGVVTYETMFFHDYVQLCHINEFYCVFIANAKTTQAPDSTLPCLLLKWKVLGGMSRTMNRTDPPADSCSFWGILVKEDSATPAWTVQSQTSVWFHTPPAGLLTFQAYFGFIFIMFNHSPAVLTVLLAVEKKNWLIPTHDCTYEIWRETSVCWGQIQQCRTPPEEATQTPDSLSWHVSTYHKRAEWCSVCTKVSPSCFWLAPRSANPLPCYVKYFLSIPENISL